NHARVLPAAAHPPQLELVPAEERLLHQPLAARALAQGLFEEAPELAGRAGGAPTVAAERDRGPQDDREAEAGRNRILAADDARGRNLEPRVPHRLAEALAVLGATDRLQPSADQLDPERLEHTALREPQRQVECRLPAQRRQQ